MSDYGMKDASIATPEEPTADGSHAVSPAGEGEGAVFGVRKDLVHINFTKADHYWCILTFLMIGTTQLLIWNFVINVMVAMENTIWPKNLFSNLLGGFEHGMALVVALIFMRFDGLNKKILNIAGLVNVVLYLVFPLVTQFLHGNDHIVPAKIVLCIVSACMGMCVGVFHSTGYAFAAVTPTNYCGYLSAGNGVSGAVSFIVYEILYEAIFKQDTLKQQQNLVWVFFVFGSIVALCQFLITRQFLKKEWLNDCIEHSREKHRQDMEKAYKEYGPRRSLWRIFKDSWVQIVATTGTLGFTVLLFPVTGPFGWDKSASITSGMNGTFQMVDLVTRFFPTMGKWFILPRKLVMPAAILRVAIFMPLFLLPAHIPEKVGFLGHTGWLFAMFVVFTATNGYIVSSGTLYVPASVTHPAEKELVVEMFVVWLLAFITIGIFMSSVPMTNA